MVSLYYLKNFFSTNFKLFLFYSYSIIGGFYENIKYIYEDYADFFNNINITNTLKIIL